jgi:hypothetical protein
VAVAVAAVGEERSRDVHAVPVPGDPPHAAVGEVYEDLGRPGAERAFVDGQNGGGVFELLAIEFRRFDHERHKGRERGALRILARQI